MRTFTYVQWRAQKIFTRGFFIQWRMVGISIWCALFVTSRFDAIFMFSNHCWHNRHIHLHQGSPTWCPRAPGRPRVCSKNNISMINVFTLTNIKTKIIAGKLSKTFISEVCIKLVVLRNRHTRSSSQFQKGWWPLIYTHSPYFMCHCTEYKLSALQGTISEENKLNATAQQFIAAKISGCVLKQGTIRAIYNGKMRLR